MNQTTEAKDKTDNAHQRDNELIAQFMGWRKQEPGEYNKVSYWKPDTKDGRRKGNFMGYFDSMKFETSWDWLMPVVEKISKITFKWESKFESGTDSHYLRTFGMLDDETGRVMVRINNCGLHFGETLIQATYNAVVEFIKLSNASHERI